MALVLKENPGLINGSNDVEVPGMDTALLMSLLEESQCEDWCNEEQVSSWMECLEAEIRMGSAGPCSVEGEDIESFEWSAREMASSSPIDDMNWYVEDDKEMSMDGYFAQFGDDFAFNCYEDDVTSLWQETYDAAIYN